MIPLLEKAWVIPTANEANEVEACKISFEHTACHYGQPVLVLADGTALGPGDIKGGLVQHVGEHRAVLAAAGYTVVENLVERLGPPATPRYLDELPSLAD